MLLLLEESLLGSRTPLRPLLVELVAYLAADRPLRLQRPRNLLRKGDVIVRRVVFRGRRGRRHSGSSGVVPLAPLISGRASLHAIAIVRSVVALRLLLRIREHRGGGGREPGRTPFPVIVAVIIVITACAPAMAPPPAPRAAVPAANAVGRASSAR